MHRLGVYRVRPSKQIFSRTRGSRSLRWDVTDGEGDGEGEGDITRVISLQCHNKPLIYEVKCQVDYYLRESFSDESSLTSQLTVSG